MLRINANCLKEEVDDELDYIYYYKGELFTGIAYDIDELMNSAVIEYYREGKYDGQYVNEYFNAPAEIKHTLDELLKDDPNSYSGEPFTRNYTPFTGIAYRFEEEFCVEEKYYDGGYFISKANYNKNGELTVIEVSIDRLFYRYRWLKTGELQSLHITNKGLEIEVEYDKNKRLESLTLNGDYFKKLKELKELIKLPLVEDITFFKDVTAAETLYLRGNLIDDRLFNMLCENHGMDGVKRLDHRDTALTNASLNKFKRLSKRKKNRE